MRVFVLTALLSPALLGSAAGAHAADPPSIDQRIEKVKELRAKIAELKKQEAEAVAALEAELKRIQDEINKLNLPGPRPPEPPKPVDPLAAKLRAAFDDDPAAVEKKREQAKFLAELYRQGADLARDAEIGTSGELLDRVGKAAGKLLKDPPAPARKNLADVRKAVAAELVALLPTDDALSDAQRKAVADLFAKLALVIEEIAK